MAKKVKKTGEITIHSRETRIFIGLLLFIFGLTVLTAPFFKSDGSIFGYITDLFGNSSIVWGLVVLTLSGKIITENEYLNSRKTFFGIILLAIVSSIFFAFWEPEQQILTGETLVLDHSSHGGQLGYELHSALKGFMGKFIEFVLIFILGTIAFSLLSGISMEAITSNILSFFTNFFVRIKERLSFSRADKESNSIDIVDGIKGNRSTDNDDDIDEEREYIGTAEEEYQHEDHMHTIHDSTKVPNKASDPVNEELKYIENNERSTNNNPKEAAKAAEEEKVVLVPPQYPNWEYPPISLLKVPVVKAPNKEVHKRNSIIIEKTLRSFGIESKINKITIGPTVVQYALSITVGTKVAKIRNLSNDIALALATPESQIRIEAPIPGTSLIGIEIPNPEPNFVYIREMVEALRADSAKYELPLLFGKNISGQCIIQDLAKLPHLLVAGATGTGKSVGINTILTGLLMTKSPDQLKLILVDPKMVEMAPYNGIAHLLTPVITDMELVVNALQWTVEEMLRRYRILKQYGVRNLTEFNNKSEDMNMPYIVVVIDEMADLMLSTGVDVESKIVRLAQMARAVGIHLILATQRPSVDVITGLIKANVPGRAAFSVSTSIDSRVIIDQTGAEALIGKGDMLFKSPSTGRPLRLQCAWTDTPDTEGIVNFIKQQATEVAYSEDVTRAHDDGSGSGGSKGGSSDGLSDDSLFEDALEVVVNAQKASASMLQRRLRVGYNRAARLIDELYEAGAIGPQEGSNPRKVLVSSKEQILNKNSNTGEPVEEEIE